VLCLIQKLICLHIYFLHILWIAETAGTDTAGHPFRGRQNIGDIRLELFQAFFFMSSSAEDRSGLRTFSSP